MAVNFSEECDGQLTFFGVQNNSVIPVNHYVSFMIVLEKESKRLESWVYKLRKLSANGEDNSILTEAFKNDCETFINFLIKNYKELSLEEIMDKYEEDASIWHRVNRVLLYYLKNYVYNTNFVMSLNNPTVIMLENIISLDQISFRDEYYRKILKEIDGRKRVRVENYIVYDASKFLVQIEDLEKQYQDQVLDIIRVSKLEDFFKEKNILEDMFAKEVPLEVKDHNGVLAMLFLHYLRDCVYRHVSDRKTNPFVQKVEAFVVTNYSPNFVLNKNQEEAYEIAKKHMGSRIAKYVNQESDNILDAIKDYDLVREGKENKKLVMIDGNYDLTKLPKVYNSEEIKHMLEVYLASVFLIKYQLPKEASPIFDTELTGERHKSMKLALLYLGRYVYPSNYSNKFINILEDYIFEEQDFKLESGDSSELCSTKAKLNNKVSTRNILNSNELKKTYK